MRRNLLNTATAPVTARLQQYRKLQQVVGPEPRATSRRLAKGVDPSQAGPGREHRSQPALRIEVHHPVLAPVVFACHRHKAAAVPGMKRMRDREGYGRFTGRTTSSS